MRRRDEEIRRRGAIRRGAVAGLTLVVATAVTAIAAASAWAGRASTLQLRANGIPLAAGAPITAFSGDFVLQSVGSPGSVSCPNTTLTGTLLENDRSTTDAIELAAATFAGEAKEGLCSSTLAAPLQEAELTDTALPSRLTLTPKGLATLGTLILKLSPVTPPPPPHGAVSCTFAARKLKGAHFAANGEALSLSFSSHLKREPDSSHECGPHPSVSTTLSLTSEGAPVTAVLEP